MGLLGLAYNINRFISYRNPIITVHENAVRIHSILFQYKNIPWENIDSFHLKGGWTRTNLFFYYLPEKTARKRRTMVLWASEIENFDELLNIFREKVREEQPGNRGRVEMDACGEEAVATKAMKGTKGTKGT